MRMGSRRDWLEWAWVDQPQACKFGELVVYGTARHGTGAPAKRKRPGSAVLSRRQVCSFVSAAVSLRVILATKGTKGSVWSVLSGKEGRPERVDSICVEV